MDNAVVVDVDTIKIIRLFCNKYKCYNTVVLMIVVRVTLSMIKESHESCVVGRYGGSR